MGVKINRVPKMPPRVSRELEDDHYHPERLLRAAFECILVSLLVLGLVVLTRSVFA